MLYYPKTVKCSGVYEYLQFAFRISHFSSSAHREPNNVLNINGNQMEKLGKLNIIRLLCLYRANV